MLNVPIMYLVDRFICCKNNMIWWQSRDYSRDIIVDRNANILPVSVLLKDMAVQAR